MNVSWEVAQDREEDVDTKVGAATRDEKDTKRR
jgi:hypothetical protein